MDIFDEKKLEPMQMMDQSQPFNSPDWIYELNLSGIRCLAYLDEFHTELRSAKNQKLLKLFPELNSLHDQVNAKCILDGEIIILKDGTPDEYSLLHRHSLSSMTQFPNKTSQSPASFVAYDLLYYEGHDLTHLPLYKRKALLDDIVSENVDLSVSRYVEEYGSELYFLAKEQHLRGILAKRKNSIYQSGVTSEDWLRFFCQEPSVYYIGGYYERSDHREILLLGEMKLEQLIYKGSVTLPQGYQFLQRQEIQSVDDSPFTIGPVFDSNTPIVWIQPSIQCMADFYTDSKDSQGISLVTKKKHRLHTPVFHGICETK